MKRIIPLLLLALCLCTGALASESAATAVRTGLYEAPRDGAQELMRYYVGTRVEVVREVDARYVQVNVGTPGGSLMGYMRREDLVFGEPAIRSVWPEEALCVNAQGQTCVLYGYMDERSEVIDPAYTPWQVLGAQENGWLHCLYDDGRTGFADRCAIPQMQIEVDGAPYMLVEPMEGELTRAEAIAYARSQILGPDGAQYLSIWPGVVDAERLARCTPEAELLMYHVASGVITYVILFREADGTIYAGLSFQTETGDVVSIHAGNG